MMRMTQSFRYQLFWSLIMVLLFGCSSSSSSEQQHEQQDLISPEVSDNEQQLQDRFLQTATTTEPTCTKSTATRFTCSFAKSVTEDNVVTEMDIFVNCPYTGSYDYRQNADDCTCSAMVKTPGRSDKYCICTICDSGFGRFPVAVDCGYKNRPFDISPLITKSCTTFDCGGTCNGQCSKGCEDASDDCKQQYCTGSTPISAPRPTAPVNTTPRRTPAPTRIAALNLIDENGVPPKKSPDLAEESQKDDSKLFTDDSRGILNRRQLLNGNHNNHKTLRGNM